MIIALTGVIGAGKSTIAKSFSPPAYVVHADVLQHDAARRAFPFIRKDREYSWGAWPRNVSTMHMHRLLNLSLRSTHAGLSCHTGPVIVEASILSQDWFLNPLLDELRVICKFTTNAEIHQFDLIPPVDQVQRQILERARANEIGPFSDVAYVRQHVKWAEDRTEYGWRRFRDAGDLRMAMEEILGSA